MKKNQLVLLIALLYFFVTIPLKSTEILKFNEGFGTGVQTKYSVHEREDRELTISRVVSKGSNFTLVKTSGSDYKVFLEKESGRVSVCCFNQDVAYNPIRFEWPTYLVDVWMENDQIALLVTDGHTYSYVRSTKKLPKLEKGQHYLMTLLDDQSEWKVIFVMRGLAFGDPEDSVLNDTYQSVKLTSIDELELFYKTQAGIPPRESKKIKLQNGKIELNGKEIPFSKTEFRMVIDEKKLSHDLKLLMPGEFNSVEFKKEILRACGSQARAVDFFNSFEDKELAEKITKMMEESFR